MSNSQLSLSYAIRPKVIAKYFGQLLMVQAILVLAPVIVALISGEPDFAIRYIIIFVVILLLCLPTLRLQTPEHIQTNEALVLVALAFIASPLLMLYPMSAAGLSILDTLFEAISAVTTTGLTTIASIEDKPQTFLFARAWMQWYGGLGIVVFSVALLMRHQLAARSLTESVSNENLVTTARTFARRMLLVYLAITSIGFILLWMLTGNGFIALTHTFTSVSTGGFSTYTDSLAGFENPAAAYAIVSLALLGAIPLPLYYRATHKNWRDAIGDGELHTLLILGLISTALLTFFIYRTTHWEFSDTLRHGLLLGFSAQTTSGFTSLEIAGLDDAAKAVLVISMFIGGGIGSTAGGIKLLRLLILLRVIQVLLQRTAMSSHAISEPRLNGRLLEADDIQRALLLILLFGVVILLSWFSFLAFGYPAMDALFEVVSATGTVGLSTGITHTELHPYLKVVLCTDMLLGRVEIVALLIVLYPRTWFGKRVQTS
ncbi:TrkH family potassium uptake protein [Kaarinaea lacus]